MGSNIRRWLADRLPQDLSSGERVVALEIADLVWDETRIGYGDEFMAKLLHRTGYEGEKQIGKVLGKLGARGIELRMPVRKKNGELARNSAGHLIFAVRGHRRTFRVPLEPELGFELRKVPDWQGDDYSDSSPAGGTNEGGSADSSPARQTNEGDRSPAGGRLVPQAGAPTPNTTFTTTTNKEASEAGEHDQAPQQQAEAGPSAAAQSDIPAASKTKAARKPKQPQEHRADVDQVCEHFAAALKAGGTRRVQITDKWRTDIRHLIDLDGITPEQAMRAIDWAHADDFWQSVILSPGSLRKKYDQLRRQAKAKASRRHIPHQDDPSIWEGTATIR